MITASGKNPEMEADDFFRAARERWGEAEYLYEAQRSDPDQKFWIGIMFLAVVAIESMYTAFFVLKYGNDAAFSVEHLLDILLEDTDLANIRSVSDANGRIMSYWTLWHKDLRYLDYEYFIKRVRDNPDKAPVVVDNAPSIIGEKTYIDAKLIIEEGEKLWVKSKK